MGNNSFLEAFEEINNYCTTENGEVALKSTLNPVLDAFGILGGCETDYDALDYFMNAFKCDPILSMRMLFYFRDCRGGQGLRHIFRVILKGLAFTNAELVKGNLDNVLFYGRGDDLLCLFDTPCENDMLEFIKCKLDDDILAVAKGEKCSLLAKWLPSENASSNTTKNYAERIISYLNISPKHYRKILSFLRSNINIVERQMSKNDWESIDFEKVPSKASLNYSLAFYNHCTDKYEQYLNSVKEGNAKINANVLFPVDIVKKALDIYYRTGKLNKEEKKGKALDALWEALPNYFEGLDESGICVVDTSGSMTGTPMEVAISLGMYCADKCKGPFKDHFITFSAKPSLKKINGDTIMEKVYSVLSSDWGMNTNIKAVFDAILATAIKHGMDDSDIPKKLYIISDMQWDAATSLKEGKFSTLIERMKLKYESHGYSLPSIVYWNVRSSNCGMFQQKYSDSNCCMVSGYSPSLFKSIIQNTEIEEIKNEDGTIFKKQKIDPMTIMLGTLLNERYDRVYVG